MDTVDQAAIKKTSEAIVLRAGGQVCDWLPFIEVTTPRQAAEVARRALVLGAVIPLAFNAPRQFLQDWIRNNGLEGDLSPKESALVTGQRPFGEQDKVDYQWAVESLWSLLWVLEKEPDLSIDARLPNTIVGHLPNLKASETAGKFLSQASIRPYRELHAMRDLYYRSHWHTRNARLTGQATAYPLVESASMERRRALEWAADNTSSWDDVDMST